MEKFQSIISKGKISTSDLGYNFVAWGSPIFMFGIGIWGLYYVNTAWEADTESNNILIGNIAFIFLILTCLYLLFLTNKKLKVTFYPDSRSNETKETVIQKLKSIKHWRVEKTEKNYYLIYENNILITSYYITIVFDETGFYLNCYPDLSRVIDFGRSKRWCNELYESIKGCR